MSKFKLIALLLACTLTAAAQGASRQPAAVYRQECGSCHVAYPTVFLPQSSWHKLLGSLDQHFGDSAELLPEDRSAIEHYLSSHSYEQSSVKSRYGDRFDTPGTPLRVTRTRFFAAIHREIPKRLVSGNPKVKSYARCQLCHRGAGQGSFDEDEVSIPR